MNASTQDQPPRLQIGAISLVAIGFGLLTIKEGGTILFGDEVARAAAGNYVPFVLWFNFLAGFAYVGAGAGLWLSQRWAVWLAIAIGIVGRGESGGGVFQLPQVTHAIAVLINDGHGQWGTKQQQEWDESQVHGKVG